jgi:PhnB protein
MSVPVDIAALATEVARFGSCALLVTTSPEQQAHVTSVLVRLEAGELVMGAGRRSRANAAANPSVTVVWTAGPDPAYCLLVDGSAREAADRADETLAVSPTAAVLHRRADASEELPSCVRLDASDVARSGYHTVTSRVVVSDVDAEVEFLRLVFDATGDVQPGRPAEMRIGDSLLMVSSAAERELFPAFLYVYVADADATYHRALDAGAVSIEAPLDTPYGDRRAMVRDPFDNVFQIAHPLPTAG